MANMASACALVLSNDKTFSPLRTWRTREAASTCVLVSISVVCICVLVVCGVFVVREYSLAVGYESTSCTVHNVTYSASIPCQHCPGHRDKSKGSAGSGGCVTSSFPCVQIIVTYSVNWGVTREGLLHSDSLDAAGIHSQCSYHVCQRNPDDNRRLVDAFALQWQTPPKRDYFTCYYNTANSYDVIVKKRYSKADVIHSMLWPSVVLVTCCVVFLYLETRRRKLTFCGRRTTDSESSPERRNTPEGSDARLLDSQIILRRSLLQNGLLDDGRVVCRLAGNADAMAGKSWKSYSSLEKLVARREDFPRFVAHERLDAKSRSFDRLDDHRRPRDRLRVDLETDQLTRATSAHSTSQPRSLDSISLTPQARRDRGGGKPAEA